MAWRGRRRLLCASLAVTVLAITSTTAFTPHGDPWVATSPGLIGTSTLPGARVPVSVERARGAHFISGSSVLAIGHRRALLVPPGQTDPAVLPRTDRRVREAVAIDRSWLHAGSTPGDTGTERAAARRALLDLHLLTSPDGGSVASWAPGWDYVWPRDAGFAAAAFCVTGHRDDAASILGFLAQTQDSTGLWSARYEADGSPVTDGRQPQLDAPGWVLWATWLWYVTAPTRSSAGISELRPMIEKAANRAASLLGSDGLPPPSSDYWERNPSKEAHPQLTTLGVAAPLLSGLRAATDLAERLGWQTDARNWRAASERLGGAVRTEFGGSGYRRQPAPNSPADAAVTFVAPPFAPADRGARSAVRRTATLLALPGGGVLPGQRWAGSRDQAWTPETGLFALSAAASRAPANPWLSWLLGHRTSLGSLPERVDRTGRPASVAPLGWTSALLVLTLTARHHPLPIPPAS